MILELPMWKKVYLVLFGLLISGNLPAINPEQSYNFLVLHSYHPSFKWNIEINEGIRKGLDDAGITYSLQMEYMDSKRLFDPIYQENLKSLLTYKYRNTRFHAIIVTDDDAHVFIQKNGEIIFPGLPVVFCGVNNYKPEVSVLFPNITGVQEKLDEPGTVELALSLFPETKEVFMVGDMSTTANDLSDLFRVKHEPKFPGITFHYLHDANLFRLADSLAKLPANSVVMLWPYLNLENKMIIETEAATEIITSASSAPVFGFWHFMLGHGIVGGKLVSGQAQGESAAQLIVKIIEGEHPSALNVLEAIPNNYYFDYHQLKRFGIDKKKLPPDSIIVNLPETFFSKYYYLLVGFLVSLFMFSVIFALQSYTNVRIRRVLKRELEFQHALIEALPTPVFFTINKTLIKDCNHAFEKLTGFKREEISGKETPVFYPKSQVSKHLQINEEVLQTHQPAVFEGKLVRADGFLSDVIFYKSVIYNNRENTYGIIESVVDITDKKAASEEIRVSEERYALATRATRDGIWDMNIKHKKLFISARLKEILGYTSDEDPITTQNFSEQIHPLDANVFDYQISLLDKQVKDSVVMELRIRQKNGDYAWTEINAFALHDENQDICRIVGSLSDITERKASEANLHRWEEIFRHIHMGVATFENGDTKPVLMNPIYANLHGYSIDEMSDIHFEKLLQSNPKTDVENLFKKAKERGHIITESYQVRKDGSIFPSLIDIIAVSGSRHELQYYIVNIQDITERKKQENKIAQMLQNEQTMNEELRASDEELRQSLHETVILKEKLEENQQEFFSFINGTSDFVFLKGYDQRYLIVNHAFANYHNRSPELIIGKKDEDFRGQDVFESDAESDQKVLQEKKPVIYEIHSGQRFFETRKFPVFYGNNRTGIGAFIRDITKQRVIEEKLAENEKRFKTLLENSFDLITLTDDTGEINYCTDAIFKLTGISGPEITGKHLSAFIHPDDRAEFGEQFDKLIKGETDLIYLQHRLKHTTTGYKQVETVATNHLNNPLINAIVFTSRDVSIEVQSHELKKNIVLAQKSAEIKQQFLANMSHEIRTPMNGIVGMIEFLLKTKLDETQTDYVNTIKSSADSLLSIINDILDYSKIEAGKLSINPSPVHVKKFFEEAPRIFSALIKQKQLEFILFIDESLPEHLYIDPIRINQVISNLLSNAIKFTPAGSIHLRVLPDKITSDTVLLRVEVQDTGIGLSEEEQKKLFNPFTQIDSSFTRAIEGTGLGLTICQRIVELMGGEIGVISETGKGSMFWFSIQTSIPEHEKIRQFMHEVEYLKPDHLGLNILLVEDKVVNQKVITMMLEAMGCSITMVSNGKEAIDYLTDKTILQAPDIILMDIQMPVMDGITATKFIRRNIPGNHVIIGLSANVFSTDVEGYLQSGLDDYIIKPATSEDLYKKLLYWKQKKKESRSFENEHIRQVINFLKQEQVLDIPSLTIIRNQANDNLVVMTELFNTFHNDAKAISQNIKKSLKSGSKSYTDFTHTLYEMSLSMGAVQIAQTCITMNQNSGLPYPQMRQIADFLDAALKNYISEVRKYIGVV